MIVQPRPSIEAARFSMVDAARTCRGRSRYEWRSENCQPPDVVNCVMLMRWLAALHGVTVPDVTPDLLGKLLYLGQPASPGNESVGALIFMRSPGESHYQDEERGRGGVNHVGLLTNKMTVIHADQSTGTVVEVSREVFLGNEDRHRGAYALPLFLQ